MAGKKTGKRLLTWVLVLVMALSLLPLNALAEDIPPEYRPTIEWTNDYLAGNHSLTVEVVHEGHSLGTISSTDKHFSATVKLSNDSIEVYDSEATGGSYSRNTLKLFTFGLGSTEGYLKLYTRSTAGHTVTVKYIFNDDSGKTKAPVEEQVKYQDEKTFPLAEKNYSCTFEVTSGDAKAEKDTLGRLAVTGGTENSVVTVTYTPEDNFIFIDKYYDNGGIFSKWDGENINLNGYKFVENNKLAEKSVIADSDLTSDMEGYRFLTVTNKDGSTAVYDFSYAVMIPKTLGSTKVKLTDVWYDRDEGDWYCSHLDREGLFKKVVVGNEGGVNFCYNTVHSENSTHHMFELVKTVDPTCTEDGYSLYKCAYCAETEQRDQTAARNHDWGSWTHDAATTGAESTHTRICKRDASHTEMESCNFIKNDGTYTCSKCGYSYGTHTAPTYPVYVYAFFAHDNAPLRGDVTVNGKPIEWNEDANNEEYKEYFVTLGVYPNGTTKEPTNGNTGLDLEALKGKKYELFDGTGSGKANGVTLTDITSYPSPSGKVCKGAAGYPEIGEKLSWHLDGQVNVYTVTYDNNDGTAQGAPTSNDYYFGSYTIAAAPKRDGYTFTGWKDGNTTYPADKEITLEKDLKLVAQWTAKEPDTVTINLSDYIKKNLTVTGNGFQGETFTVKVKEFAEEGEGYLTGSVTYAANEKDEKNFTGWTVGKPAGSSSYVFNNDGTITFKKEDPIAYSFTVDEVTTTGTDGMEYDDTGYRLDVRVAKENDKLVVKEVKSVTLNNYYNGTFPVALGQYIKKVYKSECSCALKTTFRFEALIEESVPEANALSLIESVPVEKESKVYTAKGSVTLKAGTEQTADMSIQLPEGFYEVTLKEVNDKTANVKYDKTVYTFRISVFEYDGNVEIGFSDVKKDGKEYNEQGFVFTNSYVHRHFIPVSPKPSKPTLNTGDHYAYVMGYPDGTVRPNGSITRAEVSAILFRLLSDKTRDEYFTTESSFTDVKAGAWYNNSIATLEKAGVIVDTAKGGAFRPNEAITRAELAAMLAQFSDAKPVKGVKFSDVSAEHWAYEAIAIAAKMGWIEGYPDGTFRPDATITRAEMMTLVNRALERVPSDEDHLLSKRVMLTFPDCKSGDWFYIAVQEATNSHTYERAATEKNGDEQWTALRANRDWTLLEK